MCKHLIKFFESLMWTREPSGSVTQLSPSLTLAGSCGWLPVFHTDDRQADLTLLVNVGVVYFCLEGDLGGFKGVLRREDDLNPKCSFVIWWTVLRDSINF